MPTVHLLIQGKVQGVFYRATARDIAQSLDLRGWVKNTSEGHVEAMISGSEKSVQQFIEWCKRGPEKAVVTNIRVTTAKEEAFTDFRILR